MLNIDDATAAQPSNLSLSATTFNNWVIPNTNLTPALNYSNLYKTLTVSAGAGDKFELDHTPASIDAIVLNNATAAQDEIYSTNWSVPVTANGNWSVYLGSLLHPDGSVERIKELGGFGHSGRRSTSAGSRSAMSFSTATTIPPEPSIRSTATATCTSSIKPSG